MIGRATVWRADCKSPMSHETPAPLDARRDALITWLQSQASCYGLRPETLRPASSDASFRRYFRLDTERGGTYIAMDAPPDREDSRPFVKVARLFGAAAVQGCVAGAGANPDCDPRRRAALLRPRASAERNAPVSRLVHRAALEVPPRRARTRRARAGLPNADRLCAWAA